MAKTLNPPTNTIYSAYANLSPTSPTTPSAAVVSHRMRIFFSILILTRFYPNLVLKYHSLFYIPSTTPTLASPSPFSTTPSSTGN